MFNLFKRNKKFDLTKYIVDKIFISNQAKEDAIVNEAKTNPDKYFIAWFSDTAKRFQKRFLEEGIAGTNIIEARNLHIEKIQKHELILLERYPLSQKEEDFINRFNLTNVIAYSCLEEPIFEYFGGEKVISLAKQLGLNENEAINHTLISKSIVKAQEKISKKIIVEQSASSPEEWLAKNIKWKSPV